MLNRLRLDFEGGGDRKSAEYRKITVDNINGDSPDGTSRAYALNRLRRGRGKKASANGTRFTHGTNDRAHTYRRLLAVALISPNVVRYDPAPSRSPGRVWPHLRATH